jgi:dihydropyrimidine dehydrogenase (NAD+) subunit PreT
MSDGNGENKDPVKRGKWAVTLTRDQIDKNFEEIRPPLSDKEAIFEAQRCMYCEYDVPCMRGCPTRIDIPAFIRMIAEGKPEAAAAKILESNILGGVCSRVCPVEKLCESNCICTTLHSKPIPIGRLQRYATDRLMASGELPFERMEPTGRRIAIIGAGPAGVSCAFELARLGHEPVIFEKEREPGGLDRYGIAEYKIGALFVRDELDYLMKIGGIRILTSREPVSARTMTRLRGEYDAVFLGIGMGSIRSMNVPGEDLGGVVDALHFIRQIKTRPLHTIPVGRRVIVIGAGNTAVDAATQARRLGAEDVVIVYRRGRNRAKCTDHEYEIAAEDGCRWMWNMAPVEILGDGDWVRAVRFRKTDESGSELVELPCDHLIKAIGQEPHHWLKEVSGLELESNMTVRVDPVTWMTSLPGVFAAGDCVKKAKEVVNAAYEGKRAALAIDGWMAGIQSAPGLPASSDR